MILGKFIFLFNFCWIEKPILNGHSLNYTFVSGQGKRKDALRPSLQAAQFAGDRLLRAGVHRQRGVHGESQILFGMTNLWPLTPHPPMNT